MPQNNIRWNCFGILKGDNVIKIINIKGKEEKFDLENLDYQFGLAIVTLTRKVKNSNDDIELKGVLNMDGDIVLPFEGFYKKIEIFPENNIIIVVNKGNIEETVSWVETRHHKYTGGKLELIDKSLSNNYERISETAITTSIVDKEGKRGMVVYDVADGRILSERFNTIGEYSIQPNGECLAKATTILYYSGEKGTFYDIDCYLDTSGKIKTNIYNSYANKIEVLDKNTSYRELIRRICDEMDKDAEIKKNEKQKVLERFWEKKN